MHSFDLLERNCMSVGVVQLLVPLRVSQGPDVRTHVRVRPRRRVHRRVKWRDTVLAWHTRTLRLVWYYGARLLGLRIAEGFKRSATASGYLRSKNTLLSVLQLKLCAHFLTFSTAYRTKHTARSTAWWASATNRVLVGWRQRLRGPPRRAKTWQAGILTLGEAFGCCFAASHRSTAKTSADLVGGSGPFKSLPKAQHRWATRCLLHSSPHLSLTRSIPVSRS